MIDDITLQESLEAIDEILMEIRSEKSVSITDNVIYEKVQWKRNLNSLLRKYNYNANDGTIKYNGNTYKINITRNDETSSNIKYNIDSNYTNKTGRFDTDSVINLNPNLFRDHSLKDAETVLLHEIGHIRVNQDAKTLDPKTTKSMITANKKFPDKISDQYTTYDYYNNVNNDERKMIIDKMIDRANKGTASKKDLETLKKLNLDDSRVDRNTKGRIEREKFARTTENLAEQHSKNQNYHSNQEEYEADRYAADHLPHGNNRVQNDLRTMYKRRNKTAKQDATDDVVGNRKDLSKYRDFKKYTNVLHKLKLIDPKQLNGRTKYSRDELIKKYEDKVNELKTNKDTMKEYKYFRDSLKDPNSEISKEIKKTSDDYISKDKNDDKSRKQALVASKHSDTKAFTTIDDKGTEHDKENRVTTTKNKSSQGNMMAKQNKK